VSDYALRNLDETFWRDVQQRAKGDGLTVKAVLLALCRAYLAGEITITTARAEAVATRTLVAVIDPDHGDHS
jgi:hypothetical protein